MSKRIRTLLCAILAGSLFTVGCDSNVLSEVEEVQKKQEITDATIKDLEQRLTALSAALEAYQAIVGPNLENIETRLTSQQAALENLSGKITAAEAAIANKADQSTVETAIQQVTTALETIQTNFGNSLGQLSQQIDQVSQNLSTAVQNLQALSQNVDGLTQQLGTVSQNVATLTQNLQTLQTSVNAELTTIKGRIANLETVIEQLTGTTIPAIQAQIATNEGSISTLNALIQNMVEIGAFNEFKDALLARLEGYEELKAVIAALLADYDITVDGLLDQIRLSAEEIALLKSRVQSLVFVPQYKDLKFGIPFSAMYDGNPGHNTAIAYNPPDSSFTVVYQVSPDSLAKDLAEYASEVFTFAIKTDLQPRRPAPVQRNPKLTILDAEADTTGLITFKLYHEDFEAFIEPSDGAKPILDTYAIALRIDDEEKGVHISSEYTGTINVPSPSITVDMKNVYTKGATQNDVAYTKTTNEYKDEIEYFDGEIRQPYDSCFIAATVSSVSGLETGPFSYPELKKLGFNVPQDKVTISDRGSADCTFLIRTQDSNETAIYPVDSVKVNVDSLYFTKKHLLKQHKVDACTENHQRIMTYSYDNGIGGILPMKATFTLGKANHLDFNVYYDMNWTYNLDRDIDHAIITDANAAAYTRKNMTAYPKLIVGTEEVTLDGSNAAYGIVASDFSALAHNETGVTIPTAITAHNYTVGTVTPAEEIQNDTTIVLKGVTIKSWGPSSKTKTADTLSVAGKYALPFSKVSSAAVVAHTFDRERKPIDINIKNFEIVLLGGTSVTNGGLYDKTGNKAYLIKSDNLADSVYNAFIKQEIFTAQYTKNNAFGNNEKSEFYAGNAVWTNKENATAKRFDKSINNNTPGGELYLLSNDTPESDNKLSSAALKNLARNYDGGKDNSFTYSFISYIGQQVNLNWSVTAKPKDDYKFTTYGAQKKDDYYYFDISSDYVWGDIYNIKKARTEIDLIKHKNIQIVTGAEGTGGIAPENFATYGLVPKFQLKHPLGSPVKITKSTEAPKFLSNVEYYAQVDSVAVESSMYILSDATEFLVPGSNSIYFNYSQTKMDSVVVRKFNPIAEPGAQTLTGSAAIEPGTFGTLPLNMADRNGNMVYKYGKAQNNEGNYKESIKQIFGDITFTIESVKPANQAAPTSAPKVRKVGYTDWHISEASCPELVSLFVPSTIAIGEYQIEVKASTVWKDYTYTFTVYVGDSNGSIGGNNHDYGNGGNDTWN